MKKISYLIVVAVFAFGAILAGWYFCQQVQREEDGASDTSIVKIESNDGNNANSTDASLEYAGYATLVSDEKIITLDFTNPSRSKKSMSLEVAASIDGEDIILAKSDMIRPGYKINKMNYTLDREIPKGDYKGKFIVHFFNEQGKEEIVNSEIAINVYVK